MVKKMAEEYTKEEYAVRVKKLHEQARYLRGRFLNHVAAIEREIGVILTTYFCTADEAKQELFFEGVAERLSLQRKKEILIDIVKVDYPRYWDDNKEILNSLEDIQALRNKLAHSVVDVSDEALARPIEEGVGFVQWKEGRPITDEEFDDYEVKANMVFGALKEIQQLLPFKEKPDELNQGG